MTQQLDDLLALLPDNTSGAIDAADLRTIVTTLYMNDEALLGAIASIAPAQGVSQFNDTWQVNPQVGQPGSQQISTDTGYFATATEVYVQVQAQSGTDFTNALMNATRIYGQQQTDATQWANLNVTGTPTISGTIVTIPVESIATSGTIDSSGWQNALVVIYAEV